MVAKDLENIFFQQVGRGCNRRAQEFSDADNVTCIFVGSETGDKRYRQGNQTEIVEYLLEHNQVDGMAIAVIDQDEGTRLIQQALSKGIPTITFNVDAPDSGRMAYVGQDNEAVGVEFANTLLQSKVQGGKYAIVDRESPIMKIIAGGVRKRLTNDGSWSEATSAGSPLNCEGKGDIAHRLIYEAIKKVPDLDAIISVGSYPIRDEHMDGWKKLVKDPQFANVSFIAGGGSRDSAIQLLKEGYIHSLVGAQPFMLGVESIDRLYELVQARQENRLPIFSNGTLFNQPLISVLSVDSYLQNPVVNMHYLGNLVVFGYIAFGVIALLSIVLFGIITKFKEGRVVKGSQPLFLYMITAGALCCSSAIIPLGFDTEKYSLRACTTACKVWPWLFSVGFNTVISALYAKTRRINVVMRSARRFKKVTVTEKDVLKPFAVTMLASMTVLICWTVLDPAEYTISASSGTDYWNRAYKSFHGTCYKDNQVLPYVITLFVINAGSILITIVEAYKARNVQTEYSESKYIAIVMLCLFQAFVLIIPLLVLLQENPQAQYLVLVMSIFMVELATLLFIFVPKLMELRNKSEGGKNSVTMSVTNGLQLFKREINHLTKQPVEDTAVVGDGRKGPGEDGGAIKGPGDDI